MGSLASWDKILDCESEGNGLSNTVEIIGFGTQPRSNAPGDVTVNQDKK